MIKRDGDLIKQEKPPNCRASRAGARSSRTPASASRSPNLHNGEHHEYLPDFIVRLAGDAVRYLILETKGYDPLEDMKTPAARRWVQTVNADGGF